MPGYDRTGPQGMGPMSGWSRGLCNPAGSAQGPVGSRGVGFGFGRGRCFGRGARRGMGWGYGRPMGGYAPAFRPYEPVAPIDELDALKAQADYMKGSLDAINRRIQDLEKTET